MPDSADCKVILVVRKTRLDELIRRFNTVSQARFYVEHLGADFSDYLEEHERYWESVAQAEASMAEFSRVQRLDRAFLPNFLFGPQDTVVVLGQDGLVANTMKYLDRQPVVGVNPDPKRWDGVLLPFCVEDLPRLLPEVLKGMRSFKEITMAKAVLNTGQEMHAVNDLFIGVNSHVSARYSIGIAGREEQQSSSGVIVSTGLGSTGWMRSVITGARAVLPDKGRKIPEYKPARWNADYLTYSVREPFPSKTSSTTLVFGLVTRKTPLTLVSMIPENGVIFSDGIERDFLEFNSGTRATVSPAEKRGRLVH